MALRVPRTATLGEEVGTLQLPDTSDDPNFNRRRQHGGSSFAKNELHLFNSKMSTGSIVSGPKPCHQHGSRRLSWTARPSKPLGRETRASPPPARGAALRRGSAQQNGRRLVHGQEVLPTSLPGSPAALLARVEGSPGLGTLLLKPESPGPPGPRWPAAHSAPTRRGKVDGSLLCLFKS